MRIFIASPVYRQVEFKHYMAMLRLFQTCAELPDVELTFGFVPGDADVARARNVGAAHFLRSDADVMLSIDADIWFTSADAIKLCREAMQSGVVGALYMVRSIKDRQPAPLIEIDQAITFAPGEPLAEVKYLATGFMAVRRDVFEALSQTLPTYMQSTPLPFQPFFGQFAIEHPVEGHLYLSEDYAFCHRAREAGFHIWLDPTIRLGHIGQYEYRLEDFITEFPPPMPLTITQRAGFCEIEPALVASPQERKG